MTVRRLVRAHIYGQWLPLSKPQFWQRKVSALLKLKYHRDSEKCSSTKLSTQVSYYTVPIVPRKDTQDAIVCVWDRSPLKGTSILLQTSLDRAKSKVKCSPRMEDLSMKQRSSVQLGAPGRSASRASTEDSLTVAARVAEDIRVRKRYPIAILRLTRH